MGPFFSKAGWLDYWPLVVGSGAGAVVTVSGLIYLKGKLSKKDALGPDPETIINVRRRLGNKPYDLWNTALFFPCYYPEEKGSVFAQLVGYLESAERSLSICVMSLTYDPLINAIIKQHVKGVKVRVFTSYGSAHDQRGGKAGRCFMSRGTC
jgi:hypothetical protein